MPKERLEITSCFRNAGGFLVVEAMYRGQRHHMNYMYYTKREALKKFRAHVLGQYALN